MVYVGIVCATTLIKISLLALDKSFSFQPTSLFANFSFKSKKVLRLDLPNKEGSPRYFSRWHITFASNLVLNSSWMSRGVFLLQNNDVFAWFNSCPEAFLYTPIILLQRITLYFSATLSSSFSLSYILTLFLPILFCINLISFLSFNPYFVFHTKLWVLSLSLSLSLSTFFWWIFVLSYNSN